MCDLAPTEGLPRMRLEDLEPISGERTNLVSQSSRVSASEDYRISNGAFLSDDPLPVSDPIWADPIWP